MLPLGLAPIAGGAEGGGSSASSMLGCLRALKLDFKLDERPDVEAKKGTSCSFGLS